MLSTSPKQDSAPSDHYIAIAQRNSCESPLLRLPAEIRNQIWGYVFEDQEEDMNIMPVMWKEQDTGFCSKCPGINVLRTCRQIYAETAAFPYSVNLFWFWTTEAMEGWISFRTPQQVAAVHNIALFCGHACKLTKNPLCVLPGLKTMHIDCVCEPIARLKADISEPNLCTRKDLFRSWRRWQKLHMEVEFALWMTRYVTAEDVENYLNGEDLF